MTLHRSDISLRERALVWLFRITGGVEAMAFIAVILPFAWMQNTHLRIGLGELPDDAVVRYLIRSVSFFYGVHGVLMWVVAADVQRYRPLVVFLGVSYFVSACFVGWITLAEGLPWWWTAGESGSLMAVGVTTFILVSGVPGSKASDTPPV